MFKLIWAYEMNTLYVYIYHISILSDTNIKFAQIKKGHIGEVVFGHFEINLL